MRPAFTSNNFASSQDSCSSRKLRTAFLLTISPCSSGVGVGNRNAIKIALCILVVVAAIVTTIIVLSVKAKKRKAAALAAAQESTPDAAKPVEPNDPK